MDIYLVHQRLDRCRWHDDGVSYDRRGSYGGFLHDYSNVYLREKD